MPAALFPRTKRPPPTATRSAIAALILDDVRFDRHRLARLCSGLPFDCRVSTAATLETFAQVLAQNSFDLILIDYSLPDGNGMDALQMVHLSPRNLQAAALLISDDAPQEVQQQATILGCAGYLPKNGLNTDLFTRAVTKALSPLTQQVPAPALNYTADQVQHLLAMGTRRCAQDIKPTVSRMMRQMRDLRARQDASDIVGLQAIEQNCLSLWIFLIEMEREGGRALLSQVQNNAVTSLPTAKPRSKHPSPFGGRRR